MEQVSTASQRKLRMVYGTGSSERDTILTVASAMRDGLLVVADDATPGGREILDTLSEFYEMLDSPEVLHATREI